MLSLPDAKHIRAALNQPLDTKLHSILADELATAEACGVENLTHILVVQPGDTEEAIQQAIGWSPLCNPMDDARYGTENFLPYWAWLEDQGGYYVLLHPVSNDGFAYILLVEDAPGTLDDLLRMCRQHAREGEECAF